MQETTLRKYHNTEKLAATPTVTASGKVPTKQGYLDRKTANFLCLQRDQSQQETRSMSGSMQVYVSFYVPDSLQKQPVKIDAFSLFY